MKLERADEARAGLLGRDDLVDVPVGGRHRRLQLLLGVALLQGDGIGACGDRPALDDRDGLMGAHDPDRGSRPGEREVGAEPARVHDDVGPAVGLTQHDRHARHGRARERLQQRCPVADDAGPLLLSAGEEARRVDQDDEREAQAVAEVDEHAPFSEAGASIAPPR